MSKLVVSRRTITRGQAMLYDLTEKKVKANEAITLDEAIEIYSTKVCREIVNGVPHGYVAHYNYDTQKYRYELEPLDDYTLAQRSIQWLMQAIGALVMKGYLKVTPMVKLSD